MSCEGQLTLFCPKGERMVTVERIGMVLTWQHRLYWSKHKDQWWVQCEDCGQTWSKSGQQAVEMGMKMLQDWAKQKGFV